ncbi:putative ribonuclease H-like domain-containing protein [Tanacetum coccineum]
MLGADWKERRVLKALMTVNGESVDWTTHSEDDENFAFMASNSSGSDTQVPFCSNECKESYANLKRLYDAQREQLSDASVEIKAYTQGLKKVEAQLVAHQQGQLCASDKFGLGYGDYRYSGILSYENEVLQSVFKGNKSDFENPPLHKKGLLKQDNPHRTLKNKGIIDSGCSRHMTGNKAYLCVFQDFIGGPVGFGGGLACLIAKATTDESNKWHRRLGHVNFKNLNRLVKGNLVRGLPTKLFLNDHTCVACQKGKQHKASCKAKLALLATPYNCLHMDIGHVIEFCGVNGSRGNYSNAKKLHNKMELLRRERTGTPYWRHSKTMLADAFLPNTFWEFPREEEQVFMDDLARFKARNEANEEAEALREGILNKKLRTGLLRTYLGDPTSAVQTRSKVNKSSEAHAFVSYVQQQRRNNHKDFHHCLFACFLSQHEPKKISEALEDERLGLMLYARRNLLQFEIQKVMDPSRFCLMGKRAIRYKVACKLVSMVIDEGKVMLVNALRRFRESLRRVTDGAEAFLILTLFILCLDKVSTDHAKLVPLGKVCTAKETLEKNTAKGTKCKLEPLISLTDDLSLLSNMAALESCPKHNMIAYLEKTEGNVEFHEVIDFLRRSYIYHALTVSPVVSTTFVEQFWTSAKSKTINNVRHITAKVAGKFVSISEASIRTDLIFDDADGIDSLPNQAIFDAIQRMGYEGDLTMLTFNKALFSPQWRFLFHTINHCLSSKSTSWDQIPTNIATADEGASSKRLSDEPPTPSPAPTSEVPNESLPDSSSAQPSEVPFEQQPDPSPRPSPRPSPTPIVTDSIPEPTGENLGDHSSNDTSLSGNEDDMTLQNVYDLCISLCKQVSDQAKEIKLLKAKINKLKKQAQPVIKHHKAYLKTVSLQQRFPRKSFSKKHRVHKESVSKQGRKIAKGESSVQRDPLFDVMPEDKIDHMETENAQSEGRTREMVDEDKEFVEVRLSTEDVVSTDKEGVSTDFEKVSTDFEKVSTDRPIVSTDGSKVSTDEQVEGTEEQVESTAGQIEGTEDQTKEEIATQASQTPTSMIFGDDETIATLLLNMSQAKAASKEKEKGVELKDVEEIDRPRPTSTRSLLTLKPLPKIDPKDKGKKKIEEEDESESEDDDIPQAVKKFKQLESDEEMARKIQEEWEAEEERNKIAEEKATNEALIKNFDDIKARIEADRILAEKLQEQEREQFTIEERAKFLHDTIAAQRKFLARQRSEAIRNRPPTKNQLRNQMMTYLKHVGNFKHSELKNKKFEDIQAMYEKIKRKEITDANAKAKLESEEESTTGLRIGYDLSKKVLTDLESKNKNVGSAKG